jgi:flagellin-like protein
MKKLFKSRKALSPVVAAIILIAVTVAVSIAVAAWMGALTFTFMKTEELKIVSMSFQGTSGNSTNTIVLSVKNTGTGPVTVDTIKVNGASKTFSGTTTYDPGASGTITIQNVGWSSGNKYKVDVISSTGTPVASYSDTAP